jgi:hypothetical protein
MAPPSSPKSAFAVIFFAFLLIIPFLLQAAAFGEENSDIVLLPSVDDRSTGSEGAQKTADFILNTLTEYGLDDVGAQEFDAPVPTEEFSVIEIDGKTFDLHSWGPNLVYLSYTPAGGIRGPLIYVGNGDIANFDAKPVQGSIVLMDMNSGGNWLNAASFGAAAVIFIGNPESFREEYIQKNTTAPVAFPRYWASPETGHTLQKACGKSPVVILKSKTSWRTKTVRNCYGFLRGRDRTLQKELVILEAFYDVNPLVIGPAPGADETISASVMLTVARALSRNRPDRSVLFLFCGGNREEQAGARRFVQVLSAGEKEFTKKSKALVKSKKKIRKELDLVKRGSPFATVDPEEIETLCGLISQRAKDRADRISRALGDKKFEGEGRSELRSLRQLSVATRLDGLSEKERSVALNLLAEATADLRSDLVESEAMAAVWDSALKLKKLVEGYNPALFLSICLSSGARHLTIVENGAIYPIKDNIRRMSRAARFREMLSVAGEEIAKESGLANLIVGIREQALPGEGIARELRYGTDVAAIAGLPAVALAYAGAEHATWSTPFDTPDKLNSENLGPLALFVSESLRRVISYPSLKGAVQPGVEGFSSLTGQAMYIRSGELFPDEPAAGAIITVLQGGSLFRGVVRHDGSFFIPGLANNRLTLEKAIIESYALDPETGRVSSAIDRLKTGKDNYRVRIKSGLVSTSLVMFRCEQTDIFPLFNPATLGYLTRAEILDAKTDSAPMRYWSSLMDRRDNMAISVFLEKGRRFKIGVGESLLGNEMLILNADKDNPIGSGFMAGAPPVIPLAYLQTANDLFFLNGSRLASLSEHGINNATLKSVYDSSAEDLEEAGKNLSASDYSHFWTRIIPAWAKQDVVYREIDHEQKDVLSGVMFFIALFVPFAYCMERYLFGFRQIYKQIAAFLTILIATILVIRALHPAFQLTYSPLMVIMAFFIMCLSLFVSWIIFSRFEQELARGRRDYQSGAEHVSRRQAFGAGFSIGVSNLNRRKLRTALTCATLVVLTFTVMSFTSVKSSFRTSRTRIDREASYPGILVRSPFKLPISPLLLEDIKVLFGAGYSIWPKAWIKAPMSGQRNVTSIFAGELSSPVEGVLGVGYDPPEALRKTILRGRWFQRTDEDAILISSKMADQLRLGVGNRVILMGRSFRISGIFDVDSFESFKDLDREQILPAYMESGQGEDMSEAEMEAVQSGEQLLPRSANYRYADAGRTVVIPFDTCVRMGGDIQSVSVMTGSDPFDAAVKLSSWLTYPVLIGAEGTWFQSTGSTMRYQGASNLVVPILLVILITLNTMISHVYERKREIATYTSVGLAPAHVGFLFIVEALSLAVISVVIGYIIAQFSAHFLAGTALFSKLTFNYSSLASVACMLLVFSVVFIAALYPAHVATNIAMPDVNRIWKLPPAIGDQIRMNLPFLLKSEEEFGVMNFLYAFFSAHRDSGHGSFTMEDTQLGPGAPLIGFDAANFSACILFEANAWLAPFDFGMKQRVHVHCCPSYTNPGYLELAIFLTRLSGEHSAWERANKRFVKELRKQMLLWRLLDAETKAGYARRPEVDGKSLEALT